MGSGVTPVDVFADVCCGSGAVALRVAGGPLAPPTGYMGGKRRYASAILGAAGIRPGQAKHVVMADGGAWGWAWGALLDPDVRPQVCEILRSWTDEDPVELWHRLAKQPQAEGAAERAAQWLWLQARSASNTPLWWNEDGLRMSRGGGGVTTPGQRGSWRQARTDNGKPIVAPPVQSHSGAWQMGEKYGGKVKAPKQSGTSGGRANGIRDPATIARQAIAGAVASFLVLQAGGYMGKPVSWRNGAWAHHGFARPSKASMAKSGACYSLDPVIRRLEAIPGGSWSVFHGDVTTPAFLETLAELARSGRRVVVYIDPPYVGCTGYELDFPRDVLLAAALYLAEAGCEVLISEAVPLRLEGWHHVDLSPCGRKGAKPEWLTMNRPPVRVPGRQLGLGIELREAG